MTAECPGVQMLDKDGGVFGTWLQTQMVGVVRQEDFDKFNASLRGLVIQWINQDGGLSRLVGTATAGAKGAGWG